MMFSFSKTDLENYFQRKIWIIPVWIFVLNIILKLLFIDSRDIALDEPFTIFWAQADLNSIFKMLRSENNPPLFFFLTHFWIKLFGISAFSVRFLPMIFSAATGAVIYETSRRFFNVKTGLVAALIFTFSNYHLLFAHEARVYSLFALLVVCSMLFFMEGFSHPEKRKYIFLLILVNVILIYSHFFGFITLLIQFFSCIIIKEIRKVFLKKYLLVVIFSLLFFIPYIAIFWHRVNVSATGGTWVPPPGLTDLYNMVWRYCNLPVTTVFYILILISAVVKISFQNKGFRTASLYFKVLMVWFTLPYLGMFFFSYIMPIFLDRYTVFISVGFYLLVAASINYLFTNRTIFFIIAITSIILMAAYFEPDYDNKRKIREMVAKVKELKTSGVIVIICPSWLDKGFAYYYDQEYFKDWKNLSRNLNTDNIFPVDDKNQLDTTKITTAKGVVYLSGWTSLVDPEGKIRKYLVSKFENEETWDIYNSDRISFFSHSRADIK